MNNTNWQYSKEHKQICLVIEEENLWGETFCQAWFPRQNAVIRIRACQLKKLDDLKLTSTEYKKFSFKFTTNQYY